MFCQRQAEDRAWRILISAMRKDARKKKGRTHGKFREILASFFPLCGGSAVNRSLAEVVAETIRPQIDLVCKCGYSRPEVEAVVSTIVDILAQYSSQRGVSVLPCESA